jgi:uncharacterized protein Veg
MKRECDDINCAKEFVGSFLNKECYFDISKGRGKREQTYGTITSIYPAIFSVNIGEERHTYSYADVLSKTFTITGVKA